MKVRTNLSDRSQSHDPAVTQLSSAFNRALSFGLSLAADTMQFAVSNPVIVLLFGLAAQAVVTNASDNDSPIVGGEVTLYDFDIPIPASKDFLTFDISSHPNRDTIAVCYGEEIANATVSKTQLYTKFFTVNDLIPTRLPVLTAESDHITSCRVAHFERSTMTTYNQHNGTYQLFSQPFFDEVLSGPAQQIADYKMDYRNPGIHELHRGAREHHLIKSSGDHATVSWSSDIVEENEWGGPVYRQYSHARVLDISGHVINRADVKNSESKYPIVDDHVIATLINSKKQSITVHEPYWESGFGLEVANIIFAQHGKETRRQTFPNVEGGRLIDPMSYYNGDSALVIQKSVTPKEKTPDHGGTLQLIQVKFDGTVMPSVDLMTYTKDERIVSPRVTVLANDHPPLKKGDLLVSAQMYKYVGDTRPKNAGFYVQALRDFTLFGDPLRLNLDTSTSQSVILRGVFESNKNLTVMWATYDVTFDNNGYVDSGSLTQMGAYHLKPNPKVEDAAGLSDVAVGIIAGAAVLLAVGLVGCTFFAVRRYRNNQSSSGAYSELQEKEGDADLSCS